MSEVVSDTQRSSIASLNETPQGERVHIGFFGIRNAGKSSLVNAVVAQNLAVVSDTPGTTTDPVRKAMELLPVGPVVIIDTPGIDDAGELGELRVQTTRRVLDSIDVAVLVVDATEDLRPVENSLVAEFQRRNVPYVIALNKADLLSEKNKDSVLCAPLPDEHGVKYLRVEVSALLGWGIDQLKSAIATLAGGVSSERKLISDLVDVGDIVILVIPLDSAAPKGRLILPQQQVIRDLLDAGAQACATSVEGLSHLMDAFKKPVRLVVTDSQVFNSVAQIVPSKIPLTSFSILMARYKGTLATQVNAMSALENLTDKSAVLISEGCTHRRQCNDIGTQQLPHLISSLCGAHPQFKFTSGGEFPEDLSNIDAVVHCGGCMLNAREMEHRMHIAVEQSVPFTNYGMVIAKAYGLFDRAIAALSLKT